MRNPLPDELLGQIYRRVKGIVEKIENGGLVFNRVATDLQAIFDGRSNNVATTESVTPARKNLVVADINLAKAYEKLGLKAEYEEYRAELGEVVNDEAVWNLHVLAGVTPNKIFQTLRDSGVNINTFGVDLDTVVTENQRDANKTGTYSIRFKRTIEADPENANQSADDRFGKIDITLTERLLLELGYFFTTRKHLDIKSWTLCAGSRYAGGDAPLCIGTLALVGSASIGAA